MSHDAAAFFSETPVSIDGNRRLRTPQIEGYIAAANHFAPKRHNNPAIEQIPVGCGKSGLIAILPFRIAKGRVLVVAPNLTIRGQLIHDLDIANPSSFYRRTQVIQDPKATPDLALLDSDANLSDVETADIVVTNIHQLAEHVNRWLPAFPNDFFDLIIVDEGHHNAARSWQGVFDRFPKAKVISLTATPFRGDEQPVHGKLIYRYSFADAMRQNYIKQITGVNLQPTEISFTYEGDDRHHSLEDILKLKEENWFSRGVALAQECNKHIIEASIQWLEYLRNRSGFRHQLIGAACSITHAKQVCNLYKERNLEAEVLHSRLTNTDRDKTLAALRSGELDAIIQVEILGEGFDHPPLSVGAIFRPFRSLNAYIQFVGRIMRVNFPHTIAHPGNKGIVVSHLGMNQDANWNDFKGIDDNDIGIIRGWLKASGDETPVRGGGGSKWQPHPHMEVTLEVIERLALDPYFDPDGDDALDNLINAMREQGIEPEIIGLNKKELKQRVLTARQQGSGSRKLHKLPIQPQQRRKILRQELDTQTRVAAGRICKALGAAKGKTSIGSIGGVPNQTNFKTAITRLHHAVNTRLGIEPGMRRELALEEIESILPQLDDIASEVQAQLKKRVG